ncbi:19.4 kDa early protein [Human mastadenovirus E]|uniref:19.4 kDa early protein n=3 Tax=Human mastadenovirus E TaxID=130308 RepID=Q2KSF9_ADE04|nr:19.4 kDa protein [Human adenovirus E4]AVD49589.1 19.4 kDa protein [Human mastadenovirus E]BBH48874.1 19.4 kDa protein [Human adenovirus 4a]AAW33296.1 19.4 kDa protein [Human adenovirus E4]AVQ69139.1 19.4 kDa protein [Human mastadenovirus E]
MGVQRGQGPVLPGSKRPLQGGLRHGEGVRAGLGACEGALQAHPAGREPLPIGTLCVGQVAIDHKFVVKRLGRVAFGAELTFGSLPASGTEQGLQGVELGGKEDGLGGVGVRAAVGADGFALHEPGEVGLVGVKNQFSTVLFDAFLTSGLHELVSPLGNKEAVRVPVDRLYGPVLEWDAAVLVVEEPRPL